LGAHNHLSRRLCNLTTNLTAYIFGTKHDTDNRASALKVQMVSYIIAKFHKFRYRNRLKWDRRFTNTP